MNHPVRKALSLLIVIGNIVVLSMQSSTVNPLVEKPWMETAQIIMVALMTAELCGYFALYGIVWLTDFINLFDFFLIVGCGVIPLFILKNLDLRESELYRYVFSGICLRVFRLTDFIRQMNVLFDLRWINLALIGFDSGKMLAVWSIPTFSLIIFVGAIVVMSIQDIIIRDIHSTTTTTTTPNPEYYWIVPDPPLPPPIDPRLLANLPEAFVTLMAIATQDNGFSAIFWGLVEENKIAGIFLAAIILIVKFFFITGFSALVIYSVTNVGKESRVKKYTCDKVDVMVLFQMLAEDAPSNNRPLRRGEQREVRHKQKQRNQIKKKKPKRKYAIAKS